MESNNYPNAKALLEKYHAGQCSKDELILLDKWYHSLGKDLPDQVTNEEKDLYRQQFFIHFRNSFPIQKRVWISRPLVRWAAAACVVLIAGMGYIWFNQATVKHQPPVAKVYRVDNETEVIRKVTLTDSSVVWLNAHASLRWNDDFNKDLRNVELTGEGYFDVHKDSSRPFVVHTSDLTIRVLGTAFNIENYQAEKMTKVSLVHGSVQVRLNKDSSVQTLLRPGYAASFLNGSDSIRIGETDAVMAGAWKEGGFAVKDISVRHAIRRLSERYGYNVHWKNEKNSDKLISVAFTNESFEDIIHNLCYMIHKKYTIRGKQVTIF